jgi:DNA ligase (NAD+)
MPSTERSAAARVAELRQQIDEHNRRYYQEAAPTITDREYDALYRELQDLETQHPDLAAPDSPTQRVGGAPLTAFTQVTHRAPMLSLDNTYSEEEVVDFYKRLERLLPGENVPVVIEPKVDGVAVSLLYENGNCATRRRAATARSATTSRRTSARSAASQRS